MSANPQFMEKLKALLDEGLPEAPIDQKATLEQAINELNGRVAPIAAAFENIGVKNAGYAYNSDGSTRLTGQDMQNGMKFMRADDVKAADDLVAEELGMNKKSAFLQMSGTGTAHFEEPFNPKSRFIESADAENERLAQEAAVEEQKLRDAKNRDDAFLEELEAERQRAEQDRSNDEEIGAVDMGDNQAPEPKNKSKFIPEEDKSEEKEENQLKEDILDLEGCDDTYKTYLSTLANFGMGSPEDVHNIMNGMLAGNFYDRIAKDEENGQSKIKYKNGKVFVEYEQGGKLVIQTSQKQGEEGKVSIGFKGGKFTQSAANDIILQHKARGSSGPLKLRGSRDKKQKMWLAAQAAGIAIDDSSFQPKKKDWKALQKYKEQLSVEQTVAGAVEAEVPGISPEVENKIIGIHEKLNAGLVQALNAFDLEKMAKIEAIRGSFQAYDENGQHQGLREDLTVNELRKIDKALGKNCKNIDKGMEAAGIESEIEFISTTLNQAFGPVDQVIGEGLNSENKEEQAKAVILQNAIRHNVVGLIANPDIEKRHAPLAAAIKTAEPLHQAMQQEGNKVDNMLEALGVQDIDGLVQSMTGNTPESGKSAPANTAAAAAAAGFGKKAAEKKHAGEELAGQDSADIKTRSDLALSVREQIREMVKFDVAKSIKKSHKGEKKEKYQHTIDSCVAKVQQNIDDLQEIADKLEDNETPLSRADVSRVKELLQKEKENGTQPFNRTFTAAKNAVNGKALGDQVGQERDGQKPAAHIAASAGKKPQANRPSV